ncbi:MAG: glycosyltransferase family 2 protein [archaeon]
MTVIVPAYNDENVIQKTLKEIKKNTNQEVIVVDDGSKDDTFKEAMKVKGVKVIRHETNKGKGEAMRTGAREAKEDILIFIDSSQFDPREIPKLERRLKHCDMVVGARDMSVIPWQRVITNKLTCLAIFLGTLKKYPDCLSGFRAIRKSTFLKLDTKMKDYRIEAEIMFKAGFNNLKVEFVPVKVTYEGENPRQRHRSLSKYIQRRLLDESFYNIVMVLKCWVSKIFGKQLI